ncbi:IPExxxVDY family protein [Flavobacterium croceum]|uniref:IPExxxVDY family protein n=1 Tax=Flavobacterium croceum TaxID=370975 RepID=UPI0024A901C5|nr:IPExxxVDY family protein [Flavobacterium croceum]
MGTIKLHIDDFEENDYLLIAIHTTLEDYRLAYFLNKYLGVQLQKQEEDIHIQVKENQSSFSLYSFYDKEQYVTWNLVQNKNEIVIQPKEKSLNNLFSENLQAIETTIYLLPELKKVDYFLKIENLTEQENLFIETLKKLKTIEKISLVYNIDTNSIKNKNNLIF